MPLPHAARPFADIVNGCYSYFFSLLFGQALLCFPDVLKEFMYVWQVERSYQDRIKTATVNESMNTDSEVKKYKQLFPFIFLYSAYFTDEVLLVPESWTHLLA